MSDPYIELLSEWNLVRLELESAKARELDLRLKLFAGAFPNPKEGTNTHKMPDGRALKGRYIINRRVDEAALPGALTALREQGCANTDALVKYKPELSKTEWNSLSEEQKLIFSPALIATPGTPQFEVVLPKVRKGS